MSKAKTAAAIVISLVGLFALSKMFIAASTDQGGESREFANRSAQGLEEYKKALAESRNASSQVSTSSEVATEVSPFKFPQVTCGDTPSGSGKTWYPVFIDGGNLENIQHQYCNDAIATTRKDTGVATVQLASFDSRDKALAFARQVGGEVGEPTVTQSSSSIPGLSQPIPQEKQSTLQALIEKQKAEQEVIKATNRCQEKYLKIQEQSNEIRESTASYPSNFMTDFADNIVESNDQMAKAELQSCLAKAQLQGKPRAGE